MTQTEKQYTTESILKMDYTDLSEAKRRLSQSRTWYARLCAKNTEAEAAYREKIERLAANVDALEASK